MPKIDPLQLLQCLDALLNYNGGIASHDDVSRILSLMQKFSRKLVSRCIYLLILKHTDQMLLEVFLNIGGWPLISNWLTDAYNLRNWSLIDEILRLFVVMPMNTHLLKQNDAPKIVKSVSKDQSSPGSKALALEVVKKWLRIVQGECVSTSIQPEQPRLMTAMTPQMIYQVQQQQQQQQQQQRFAAATSYFNQNSDLEIPPESFYEIGAAVPGPPGYGIGPSPKPKSKAVTTTVPLVTTPPTPPTLTPPPPPPTKAKRKKSNAAAASILIQEEEKSRKQPLNNKKLSEKDLETLAAIKSTQKSIPKLGRIPKKAVPVAATVPMITTPATNESADKSVTTTNSGDDNWDDDDDGSTNGPSVRKPETTVANDDNWDDDGDVVVGPSTEQLETSNEGVANDVEMAEQPQTTSPKTGKMSKKLSGEETETTASTKRKRTVKVFAAKARNTGLDEEIKRPRIIRKTSAAQQKKVAAAATAATPETPLLLTTPSPSNLFHSYTFASPAATAAPAAPLAIDPTVYTNGATVASPIYSNVLGPTIPASNNFLNNSPENNLVIDDGGGGSGGSEPLPQPIQVQTGVTQSIATVPVSDSVQLKLQVPPGSYMPVTKPETTTPPPPPPPAPSTPEPIKKKHVLQESDLFSDFLNASSVKEVKKKRKRTVSGTTTITTAGAATDAVVEPAKFYTEIDPVVGEPVAVRDLDSSGLNESMDAGAAVAAVVCDEAVESGTTSKPKPGVLKMYRAGLMAATTTVQPAVHVTPKKRVSWKSDSDLVRVQFFEMDENERVNVSRTTAAAAAAAAAVSNQTDYKQIDSKHERLMLSANNVSGAYTTAAAAATDNDLVDEKFPWHIPALLALGPPPCEPGSQSTERETQAARERSVLQMIYFTKSLLPDSPAEPDYEYHQQIDPVIIPLHDIHNRAEIKDYRHVPWPEPKLGPGDSTTATAAAAVTATTAAVTIDTPTSPISPTQQDTVLPKSPNHLHGNGGNNGNSCYGNNHSKKFKDNRNRHQQQQQHHHKFNAKKPKGGANKRICKFYQMNGSCNRQNNCTFKHIDPE